MRRFLLIVAACAAAAAAPTLAELQKGFEKPPDDCRIMVRWWWFGPAVTKPELEREMRLMKEGGIGGFEVQPTYPLTLDGNLPYLSDEFIDALRFTFQKAKELGLRADLTLGSGWPYGGPHIPITQAAGKLRLDRVTAPADATSAALPRIGEGEKFLAAFLAPDFRRLDQAANGAVRLPGGASGRQTVWFFIASRTRMMVKRPAVGAEGFVLDHYDRAAIETHLKAAGDRLAQAFGSNPPYAIFSDSLEVYGNDWTGDFLEQFRKRRGYDLTPYLPALAADMGEKTGAVRRDWGLTMTELADERYLTPLTQWAHRHGTRFRSQTYGIPPVTMSSNAFVDLPEGEGPQWRKFSATRWAASATHLYGRPVASSETWTWLHSPVFRATPLDMKAEADLHFLVGINQLVGHGWPYSPPEAGYPGWRFYAAGAFNNANPWWIVMPDVTRYLQRVSFLLRQGKPANDVALYLPTDDARARFTLGRDSVNQAMDGLFGPMVIPQILDAGYNFDFIDDEAIGKAGIPYPVLILPGVERIPLAAYRRIEEYARRGGIVAATRRLPSLAPGLREAESDTPKVRAISETLFRERGHFVSDETTLGKQLRGWLAPDFATDPPAPQMGFVHRKLADGEIYFLVNTSNQRVFTRAQFRVTGLEAEQWDPFTGKVSPAPLGMVLEPYESRVLVFSKHAIAARGRLGSVIKFPVERIWKVTFTGISPLVVMPELRSWTDDEKTRFFSGTASYETILWVPAGPLKGRRAFLNFGEGTAVAETPRRNGMRAWLESPVREAGVVYVNGRPAGSVWRPPYEVDVTALVHAGENQIRVVVGNLALNAMAGKPLPDYKALIAKYGDRFQAQDMNDVQALPSGLLGPVVLRLE